MQDKILVIMGLVEDYHEYGHTSYKDTIESKLRELVREPLTPAQRMEILHSIPDDDDADSEWMLTDMQLQLIMDGVENAHGITNVSWVE